MARIGRVRFWQLMVGTGFALLGIGLVMIFLPPGVGDSGPFTIEFFEASIEGSEMGLALIVLGLSCFLIGRKDLADLRAYQDLQEGLERSSSLTARLVAEQVDQKVRKLPVQAAHLGTVPDLELAEVLGELKDLPPVGQDGLELAKILGRAEKGLALLGALDSEQV